MEYDKIYDKIIEQLRNFKVRIKGEEWTPFLCMEAANAIETIRAENEKLRAELEPVKRERDAAIEDLHKLCPAWKWDGHKED